MRAKERTLVLGLALNQYGALLSLCDDPACLTIADRLEGLGFKLHRMLADQVRSSYHGVRGEIALAQRYRERVELFAVQAGSSWQAELWAPSADILSFRLSGDVVGLGRVANQLRRLSNEVPSLLRHAELAETAYLHVQGDYEAAHMMVDHIAETSMPRSFIGWGPFKAGEIEIVAARGNPEQAEQLGVQVLALYSAEDLKVTPMVVPIVIALALVEAELGDLAGAAERIDAFLAGPANGGGPLVVGSLHEARAKIAIMAADTPTARLHAVRMAACFAPTENPVLIARSERLQRGLDAGTFGSTRTSDTIDLGPPKRSQTVNLLRACEAGKKRFELALQLLIEQTGGGSGCVFGYDQGQLTLLGQRGMPPPDALVHERLRSAITDHLDAAEKTASHDTLRGIDTGARTNLADRSQQRTYILGLQLDGVPRVVGVALVDAGNQRLRDVAGPYLEALAEGLLEPAVMSAGRSSVGPFVQS
jgi:hypothetical protein